MQELTKDFGMNDLIKMGADVTFNDNYKLRLSSKKLESGKYQVKFYASVRARKDLYGYVLVDAGQTLSNVIVKIREKLRTIHHTKDFHQIHLYSIGKSQQDDLNFIIFDH